MFNLILLLFRLTVAILAYVTPKMTLIDVHGNPHIMTQTQVTSLIIIGWVAFFSAWMMNILYYKVHPSDVDFSPRRFRSQMVNLVSLNFVEIIGTNSTSTSLEERECFTLFGRLDATSASVRAIVVKKVH